MSLTIATSFQMNGMIHAASAYRKNGVAGFMRALIDGEFLAAEGQHLRHERHAVQLAVFIQGAQNFFFGAHFYPVAGLEFAPRVQHDANSSVGEGLNTMYGSIWIIVVFGNASSVDCPHSEHSRSRERDF